MDTEVKYEGRFIRVVRREGWEFVQRTRVSGIVGVLAITDAELTSENLKSQTSDLQPLSPAP